jgi:hypothetical protein
MLLTLRPRNTIDDDDDIVRRPLSCREYGKQWSAPSWTVGLSNPGTTISRCGSINEGTIRLVKQS